MTTWDGKIVYVKGNEVHVQFTSSTGQVFTKRYNERYTATLLQEKLDFIEAKQSTFEVIKTMVGMEFPIREGWTFKFNYAHMPSDFIEIFCEITTPWQKFNKTYTVITVDSVQGLSDYIDNEILKVNTLIDNVDLDGLSIYFRGEEVTLDGNYTQ